MAKTPKPLKRDDKHERAVFTAFKREFAGFTSVDRWQTNHAVQGIDVTSTVGPIVWLVNITTRLGWDDFVWFYTQVVSPMINSMPGKTLQGLIIADDVAEEIMEYQSEFDCVIVRRQTDGRFYTRNGQTQRWNTRIN